MADSTSVFTIQDPLQITDPSSSFFLENPILDPSGIALNDDNIALNFEDDHQNDQEWDRFLDSGDPFSDPALWALCNNDDDVVGTSQAGPFGLLEEGRRNNGVNNNVQTMPLALSPVPASQYNCVCCQILREITHTNGIHMKRIEIHGVFGVITHAVLGIYDCNTSLLTQNLQMFDFHKESTQTVKKFLIQYFEACKQEGCIPMQDPLSTFYEALSVGLNEPDNTNDFHQLLPQNTGDYQYNQHETLRRQESRRSKQGGFMKLPLSVQRERTRKLKLKDLVDYFDLPMEIAAQKMNICPTVVKKVCRKHDLTRWPYRKVRSIGGKILKLTKILDASRENEERARAQEGIQKYKQQLADIYEQFTK